MIVSSLLLLTALLSLTLLVALGRLDHHLITANKIDLQHAAAEHPPLATLVTAMKEPLGLEWTLRLLQLLLLSLAATVCGAALPADLSLLTRLGLLALLLTVVVFVEALARRGGSENSIRELSTFAGALAPVLTLITPLLHVGRWLTARAARHGVDLVYVSQEELQCLRELDQFRAEEVDAEEEAIIGRIFDLKETEVSQIMVPIVDMVALEEDQTLNEAVQTVNRTRFSRIPVFRHRVYNIVGILHAFDLLGTSDGSRRVGDYTHPPLYVPETMTAEVLLQLLRERQIHMAVVVDEYGGATGVVTAEDVIEELVGEITDEHDTENSRPVTALPDGGWRVKARLTLDELEETTNIHLDSRQYDTVAGFLLEELHRIPQVGEVLNLADLRITIRDASERRIDTVDIVHRRE